MIKKIINKLIIEEYKEKCLVFSIISGILLAFSFERYNLYPLAWIAFVPLIYCIYKNNFKLSLLYGFVAGITYSVISTDWMFLFLFKNTKSFIDSFIVSVWMWLYLSVYICVWAGIVNLTKKLKNIYTLFFMSGLWVLLEYTRNYILSGFPINLLGYSQFKFLSIIQISDIFGVYGISFLIISINSLLFYWMYNKDKKYLIISLIIMVSIFGYGKLRINQFNNMKYDTELKVGVVQPNIPQKRKKSEEHRKQILKILGAGAASFGNSNLDILLYPETVLPKKMEKDFRVRRVVKLIAKYSDITLIGGKFDQERRTFNTMFVLSNNGQIIHRYKKKHLVLFGEYIPFEGFLSELFKRIDLADSLNRSKDLEVYDTGKCVLGINICSENYYPYLSRELVLKGATLLTTHANDAWCDGLSYPYQHFAMNIFRAIENRKYLIACANTGISGVIAPTGKIIKQTKNKEHVCFEETVYTNKYITIYDRIGDSLVLFCVLYVFSVFVFFVYGYIKRRKDLIKISK
ncbi:MAG: apolipoprotein N-acyltransferase [Elusimicrobia bacterium]|nr:apolipoprotein N-acyltransferase [Elusimicrobiota bacterium]